MALCTITDRLGYQAPDGTFTGITGQDIYAVPTTNTLRVDVGGTYRIVAKNPNITGESLKYGRKSTTDSNGQFSFALPQAASETKPTSPVQTWSILFPDSRALTGAVPAVSGPILLDDLIATHGWQWTTGIAYSPPTAGVEARGTASFTPSTSTVSVGPFLVAMSSSAYQIKLCPQVDTVTSNIPGVGWANKTTTGFDIVITTAGYTGSVDWEVTL